MYASYFRTLGMKVRGKSHPATAQSTKRSAGRMQTKKRKAVEGQTCLIHYWIFVDNHCTNILPFFVYVYPLCKMNVIMGLCGKIIVTNETFGELLTHYDKHSPQFVNNLPKVSLWHSFCTTGVCWYAFWKITTTNSSLYAVQHSRRNRLVTLLRPREIFRYKELPVKKIRSLRTWKWNSKIITGLGVLDGVCYNGMASESRFAWHNEWSPLASLIFVDTDVKKKFNLSVLFLMFT